jgi:hypothetical protein
MPLSMHRLQSFGTNTKEQRLWHVLDSWQNSFAAPHWDLCILRTSWLQTVTQLQVLLASLSNPIDAKV